MKEIFTEFIIPFFREGIKELPNHLRKEYFHYINLFYMITFILSWVFYILDPIAKTLDEYTLIDNPNPVIILSLAGFLLLSAWFILTQFSFYCTRWTLMIYRIFNKLYKYIKQGNKII